MSLVPGTHYRHHPAGILAEGAGETKSRRDIRVAAGRGETLCRVVIAVQSQADLLQVIAALQAGRRLTDLLDGGHEQCDQDADNGDDNQQFNQRKPNAFAKEHDDFGSR
jgi:hypothetical protein